MISYPEHMAICAIGQIAATAAVIGLAVWIMTALTVISQIGG